MMDSDLGLEIGLGWHHYTLRVNTPCTVHKSRALHNRW